MIGIDHILTLIGIVLVLFAGVFMLDREKFHIGLIFLFLTFVIFLGLFMGTEVCALKI